MSRAATVYFSTGIYSIAEAAKLTRVSAQRIRRWLRGYEFMVNGQPHRSPPIWKSQLGEVGARPAFGFLDLIEIRLVDRFITEGVSWKSLRRTHERARELYGTQHPFCTRRFTTDGRAIFETVAEQSSERELWDIVNNQRLFDAIVQPFLRDLDFADDEILRWWPLGRERLVVIDPQRNLGQPTVLDAGIPTAILARAYKTTRSAIEVARWYEVEPRAVADAIEFEQSLAA